MTSWDDFASTRPCTDYSLEEVLERVRRVLEPRGFVVFAYVFGSRVHGRYSLKNDVDVAVYTEEHVGWRDLVDTLNALEDELGCRVDLVHLNTAPPTLAYEVISTGVLVLDRRPEERVEYEVRVLREYLDLKPRLEEYFAALTRQTAKHAEKKAD